MPTADEVRASITRQRASQPRTITPVNSRGGGGRNYSPSPYRDPQYLEAARSTAAATDAKVRGFDREAQRVRSELQRALPRLNWEAQDAIEGVDADAETRGMFNSGSRLVAGAKVRRNLADDYSGLRQRASEAVQNLQAQAAEAQLSGRSNLANAALTTAGQLRSQQSERSINDINQRNAALQDQLRRLLGQYRGY